jgi:predicted MFS family arabinose efflux permease
MVLNPLLQRWLDQFGWRMSFRILAAIMAVCAIPCVLMMVERPEKKGLRALGADKLPQTEGTAAEAEGETMAHARGTVRYWVLATSVLLISAGCSSLVMTLSPHLTDSGYSAAFAAGMVSVSMGAMAVGKMLLGWLYDVLGSKRASLLSVLCGFLGLLGMIFCRVTPALGLIILGVGLGCAFGTVGPPIVVMNVFGKRDYSAIVGVFISFGNIGGAIAPTVNGTVYDLAGSYTPGYAAWAVALGLVLFCFTIFLPSGRKDK